MIASFEPRKYQIDVKRKLYAAVNEGAKTLIGCLPPGAGKTLIACSIFVDLLGRLGQKYHSGWFLADRRGLVTQPRDKFSEYTGGALRFDTVMAGHQPDASSRLHVASVQTVEAREISIPDWSVVIVDECHHAHAFDLVRNNPTCLFIGFTATPQHDTGTPLGDVWKALILGPLPSELVALNVLVEPEVYSSEPPPGITVREWCDDTSVVEDPAAWWRRLADGLHTVAFCRDREHARDVVSQLTGAGIRSTGLTASDDDSTRSSVFSSLRSGDLDVVCVVGLCREGWDAPWLEAILDLDPRKSLVSYVQGSARLHRSSTEARRKVHLDLAKNVWRHGPPLADRVWSLASGGRLLVDAPDLRRCPGCGNLATTMARCARCGLVYVATPRRVETVDAEIRRFTATSEAERSKRLADEERDKKRRRVLHGIAWKRWESGALKRRGDASALAGAWWKKWTSRGGEDWRAFLSEIGG